MSRVKLVTPKIGLNCVLIAAKYRVAFAMFPSKNPRLSASKFFMAIAILEALLFLALNTTNTSRPLIRVDSTLSRCRSRGLTRSTTMPVRLLIVSSFGSARIRSAISAGSPRASSACLTFFMPGTAFFINALCWAFIASMIASIASSPSGLDARISVCFLIFAQSCCASRLALAIGSIACQKSSFGAMVASP